MPLYRTDKHVCLADIMHSLLQSHARLKLSELIFYMACISKQHLKPDVSNDIWQSEKPFTDTVYISITLMWVVTPFP
jgi:hypothetical protein